MHTRRCVVDEYVNGFWRYTATYNVWAGVPLKLWSFEPMVAAAMIWEAQPQSIDAMEAMEPTVFASVVADVKGHCGAVVTQVNCTHIQQSMP